jgi:transposase InsO family protein
VKFAWIKEHLKEFELTVMCHILQVSRSGFYAARKRPAGAKASRKCKLTEQIRCVHLESRSIYGSPRVAAELARQGTNVSVNTVARYMKAANIRSKIKRRFRVSTTDSSHGFPTAPNLLERKFEADGPNQKWCCDITYVPTAQGVLYLAAVIDCFSRRIVGWAMADHMRAVLCMDALRMALGKRGACRGLVHHSDRGVQYACREYRELLESQGMVCSMSGRGDCYDNALMESFWGTLKTELVYHELYPTREEARQSIFEFIEVFYNRRRGHSAIGYVSPECFEASLN